MSKIAAYLSLIRSKNLIILAVTQAIIYYKLIYIPSDHSHGDLGLILLILLIISTILIAASGYVINDIIDVDIDRINKAPEQIVTRRMSLKEAWYYYFTICIIGFGISIYVAYSIDNLPLVSIYPLAVLLLYGYSQWWKKKGIIGNFVVSLFSSLVVGIIWFAERYFIADISAVNKWIIPVFLAFMIFSFLISMYREIVKDIEDIDGDRALDYLTLPITAGVSRAKYIAMFFGVVLMILMSAWGYYWYALDTSSQIYSNLWLAMLLIMPLGYIIYKTNSAIRPNEFDILSKWLKLMMLSGLIYLCIL